MEASGSWVAREHISLKCGHYFRSHGTREMDHFNLGPGPSVETRLHGRLPIFHMYLAFSRRPLSLGQIRGLFTISSLDEVYFCNLKKPPSPNIN